MRFLYGDTCGSSSGAGSLRSPGTGTGRNRPRGPDGRRTLLYPSAVGHDSHGSPQTGPRAGIYSLCRPLYSTSGGSDMALILIFYLTAGPFSSARGQRQERQINPQFTQERPQNAKFKKKKKKNQGHPFISTTWSTPVWLKSNQANYKNKRSGVATEHTDTHSLITIINGQIYFSIWSLHDSTGKCSDLG